jgi:Fe2+ or Zn2+ uptake regulation protein
MMVLTDATWLRYYRNMNDIEPILKKLKNTNLRKTKLRIFLLDAMLRSSKPISASDLLIMALKCKIKVHKTSVYRQLSVLKEEKIIREIQFGENKKRYEIYPENHHHHIVCTNCGNVEDIDSEACLKNLEKKIASEKKFKVINHSLEIFGHCASCKS